MLYIQFLRSQRSGFVNSWIWPLRRASVSDKKPPTPPDAAKNVGNSNKPAAGVPAGSTPAKATAPPKDPPAAPPTPPATQSVPASGKTNPRLSPPTGIITNSKTKFGPLDDCDRIFQNLYGRHDWRLQSACSRGDWHRTADLLEMGPEWIMEQVAKSGLRGRGGAGFYAAIKWNLLRQTKATKSKVIIVNCAEGEPGSCKDREILRHEPHKLIEGSLLAGFAMGCPRGVIYTRNRFYNEACNMQYAIAEAYRYGLLGDNACDTGIQFDLRIQRGYSYLCGEETALLNCLMGKQGRPRPRPPYLSEKGYFDHPCLVINAESLAVLPTILRRGPAWFASLGRSYNSGTKLFNISGDVNDPCTVEEEMSIPLQDLIEIHAGGVKGGWENLLGVHPGGLSTKLLDKGLAEDVVMDFDCLKLAGSALGTGGVIVISKDCDPLKVMLRSLNFYSHNSCKQCTPCRDGSIWLPEILERLVKGESQAAELEWLPNILKKMEGTTICHLAESQASVVRSLLENFREEIDKRIMEYSKDC